MSASRAGVELTSEKTFAPCLRTLQGEQEGGKHEAC